MSRSDEPKRILLVRNDGIGDVVLTLPAMLAVRRRFPEAYIAALLTCTTAPLVDATRAVNDVIIDERTESAGQLGSQLRTMRFDAALVFNTNTRNALAVWARAFAGASLGPINRPDSCWATRGCACGAAIRRSTSRSSP